MAGGQRGARARHSKAPIRPRIESGAEESRLRLRARVIPDRIPLQELGNGCAQLPLKGTESLSKRGSRLSANVEGSREQDGGLTMVICSLLGSLRVCLERHPPLVTFFFCLLSLAVAFVGFAAYIQSHDVQNPDVKEDWNSLLKSLAHLMFCIPNKTQESALTPSPSTTTAETPTAVSVMVGLTFDLHYGTDPPNGTRLGLTVTGEKLGLKGPDAQESIHFLTIITNSVSHVNCLSITAPSSLLPKTRQPPKCVIEEWDMHQEETGICYQPHYQTNPALSSMLDQADRALCSQRLLMTSAFLLCLCAILCCAAGLCYPNPRDKWGQI
ncbi:insulin-like growth factor-binding protein 3 receptor [Lacerta agilis]|uniref:insulin-like growth factor-binding protein 3 receptor n=1 Tax=Lacerta agilis TaxID=80427 RepID=UPI0014194449|nr:insulin-like growth factor-binding protein 3 receptor [Lacerta agilis]